MISTRELSIISANGRNTLYTKIWYDNSIKYKGILQIAHGMIEHIERYNRFARYLVNQGYLVIGHDHLGHGKTAANEEELGYFPDIHMSQTLVDDMHQVSLAVKKEYPQLPLFILGHSMGSLLLRRYVMTYGDEIQGALILGTGRITPLALKAGELLVKFLMMLKGDDYHSPMIECILFGAYNKRFSANRFGKEWLTKDKAIVDEYMKDEFCHFTFSLSGIMMLIDTMKYIQNKAYIREIPGGLPVVFMSGTEDPFGDYGRGVNQIYERCKKSSLKDVTIRMYDNDRHEILNETDYRNVYKDIRKWLDKHCS